MQVDMCGFTRVHGLAGVNSRSSVLESEHKLQHVDPKGILKPRARESK